MRESPHPMSEASRPPRRGARALWLLLPLVSAAALAQSEAVRDPAIATLEDLLENCTEQLATSEQDAKQLHSELEACADRPDFDAAEKIEKSLAEQERLATENQALQAEVDELTEQLVTSGPAVERLRAEHGRRLLALVEAMLAPGECDRIEVDIDSNGGLSISGIAASRGAKAKLKQRQSQLADDMVVSFDVAIEPGGSCNRDLGDGWRLFAAADGAAAEVVYDAAWDESKDSLPRPRDCPEIGALAAEDETLSPSFAEGLNPEIWCVQDDRIGICRRSGYSADDWRFIGDRQNRNAYAFVRGDGN